MKWEKVKLGEVCETTSGGTPDRKKDNYFGGDIPWVKSGELSQKIVTKTSENITVEGLKNSSAKLQPPGVILLALYGATVGKCAILGIEAATNQAVCCIKPNSQLRNDFLLRYLESQIRQIIQLGVGGAQPNISQQIVRNLEIPLPPLNEQKRIATILDAADALRRTRRESLARLDELAQSLFLEMFGDPANNPKKWDVGTISQISTSVNYGTSQKSEAEGEFPYLRMNNITYTGEWNFSDLKYITLTEKDQDKYLIQKGDILFNRTNSAELVGKTATYRRNEPMAFAGYLIRVRLVENHHPEYVSAFMNSKHTKGLLRGMCKSIIGMANINAKELGSIKIPLPPLPLQQSFARQIEELETIKTRARAQLLELDALFASLQERAFSGQL